MKVKLLEIREAVGPSIHGAKDVAHCMTEEARADRECFWALHLNTKGRIIEKELVAIGTLDHASISPREVFRKAVINSTASIITVHNHPGNDPEPSQADYLVWQQLRRAGDILDIPVSDNIIITHTGGYYSEKAEKGGQGNGNKENEERLGGGEDQYNLRDAGAGRRMRAGNTSPNCPPGNARGRLQC